MGDYMNIDRRQPSVSVVIPIYNTEDYLPKCLDSIINQSFKDFEIICVNDGSTDKSLSILETYAETDSRVVIVNKENGGVSLARNAGLEVATGRYIMFVDSDDYIKAGALETSFKYAEEKNLDILEFSAEVEYTDNNLKEVFYKAEDSYTLSACVNQIMSGEELMLLQMEQGEYYPTVSRRLIKTDYLKKIDLSFYPGIIHEDELFVALLVSNATRASAISDRYYVRVIRENSIMTSAITYHNFIGTFRSYVEITKAYIVGGFKNKALGLRMVNLMKIAGGRYQRLPEKDKAVVEEVIKDEYVFIFKLFKNIQDDEEKNRNTIQANKERLAAKDAIIKDYQQKLSEKDIRIANKDLLIAEAKEKLAARDETINIYKQRISEKDKKIADKDILLVENKKKLIVRDEVIADYKQKVVDKDRLLAENKEKLAVRDETINSYRRQITNQDIIISESKAKIELLINTIKDEKINNDLLNKSLELANNTINDYEKKTEQLNYMVCNLENECKEKTDVIYSIQNSFSYKLGRFITWLPRKIRDILKK